MYYLYSSSSGGDIDQVLQMQEGDSASYFFTFMSIQPCLAVNMTESFSLKVRMTVNIDPRLIINPDFNSYPYNRMSNAIFMYLGEVGLAYRF